MLPCFDDYLYKKKSKISINSFKKNCWSKNSLIWLDQRYTWYTQPKLAVLDVTFPPWLSPQKNQRYWMVPSSDNIGQKILKSDWIRRTHGHTKAKVLVSDATFAWSLSPCKNYDIIWLLHEILVIKESCNLIGWDHFRS